MSNLQKSLELKFELDALRPLKKEDELRIMQKFRLEWNFHSNNLEGNSLTYGETKALILFGITAQGKPLKDHFEITGHNEAIGWVIEIVNQKRPLTENFIRELHKLILKESYEVDAITPDGLPTKKKVKVGVYKTSPNHVKTKTGEIFRFATPEETPALMNDLIHWYRNKTQQNEVNPILLAAEFHYRYIRIHPFDDGNGRTARILMNFILMQFDYPPVIIKTEDKQNYFAALQQADAGLLEPFIEYIALNLNHSLELMIKGAKGESIEEPDDLEKEIALLELSLKNVSEKIEVSKNRVTISRLYDRSIAPLIEQYNKKSSLLDRFYVQSSFVIVLNQDKPLHNTHGRIEVIKKHINEHVKALKLEYQYKGFNQTGFREFNLNTNISFQFDLTRYRVKNTNSQVFYEKMYGEQLTEEEIRNLVTADIRMHKDFIEKQINNIQ